MKKVNVCGICGATSDERIVKWFGSMNCFLCSKHKAQIYRNGKITDPSRRTTTDKNEINILSDHAEIILRNNKQEVTGVALIDLDDVEKCKNIKWTTRKDGYVYGGKEKIRLHRFVLNYEGDLDVDHKNRNPLDNRKDNLRTVPRAINAQNNSSVGVSFDSSTGKWRSYFQRYGNYYTVGAYNTFEEAISERAKKIEEVDKEAENLMREYSIRKGTPEKGVRPSPHGRWISDFWADGKKHHVGTFDTKQEAINERSKAMAKFLRNKTSA